MPPRRERRVRSSSRLRGEEPELTGLDQVARRVPKSRSKKTDDNLNSSFSDLNTSIVEEPELEEEEKEEEEVIPSPLISVQDTHPRRSLRSRSRMADISTENVRATNPMVDTDATVLFGDSFYRIPSPHRSIGSARRQKTDLSLIPKESTEMVESKNVRTITESTSSGTKKKFTFTQTVGIVALYFVISLLMVFLNKKLFNRDDVHNAMFVTWVQIVISALITVFCSYFARAFPKDSMMQKLFPDVSLSLPIALRVLPLGAVFALFLVLTNACLLYVHISFYQVARSWTIIFNILISTLFLNNTVTFAQVATALVVVAGYTLACEGELPIKELLEQTSDAYIHCILPYVASAMTFIISFLPTALSPTKLISIAPDVIGSYISLIPSPIRATLAAFAGIAPSAQPCVVSPLLSGLLYGVLSSLILSIYTTLAKRTGQSLPLQNTQLVGYTNIIAAVLLLVYMLFTGEWDKTITGPAVKSDDFWFALIIVSVVGYAINVVTFLQIEATSALGHNISGTAKATVQSALGWFIYQNHVSLTTAIGSFITILGCGLYAYFTSTAASKPAVAAPTTNNLETSPAPVPVKIIETVGEPTTNARPSRMTRTMPISARGSARDRSISRSRFSFNTPSTRTSSPVRGGGNNRSDVVPAALSWRSQFQRSARKSISRPYYSQTSTPTVTSTLPIMEEILLSSGVEKEPVVTPKPVVTPVETRKFSSVDEVTYPDWAVWIGKICYQFLTRPPVDNEDEE